MLYFLQKSKILQDLNSFPQKENLRVSDIIGKQAEYILHQDKTNVFFFTKFKMFQTI